MGIGENIKRIRLEKGLTQKQLGERLGKISQQQIGQWETGKANPKIETLQKIANGLGVSIKELLQDNTYSQKPIDLTIFDSQEEAHKALCAAYPELEEQDKKEKEEIQQILEDLETEKEEELLSNYRQLNDSGKSEALKRVGELTEIPRYTEPDQ